MKWTAKRDPSGDGDLWTLESALGPAQVRTALGPDLLLRLERAVAAASGQTIPAAPVPPRFRIDESTYSHGDLFELEQDTIWTVVDLVSGKPLWEFRGGTSHSFVAGGWSEAESSHGCDGAQLGADGLHVLVGGDYEVTCHELPG